MKINHLLGVAVLALTLNACQQSTPQNEKAAISTDTLSMDDNYKAHLIPVDSANKMIGSYLSSLPADSQDSELQSLIMNAAVLREYLADTSIRNVKIMFAHTLDYINSGYEGQPAGYKSGALTIIFAGYDAKGDYIFAPGNMVPNHTVPCPNHCVGSGSAASSLLQ